MLKALSRVDEGEEVLGKHKSSCFVAEQFGVDVKT